MKNQRLKIKHFVGTFSFLIVLVQNLFKRILETCFALLALSIITNFTLNIDCANLIKEYQQVETNIVQMMFKQDEVF